MAEHIRINAVAPRIQYVADGAQVAFPFPFAIFHAADLEIHVDETLYAGGVTVSGAGSSDGGTATFAVPPPAGSRITLRRRLTVQRTTDFQADGIIRAKSLNDELDYQIAALQQLNDEMGRALRRAPTSPATNPLSLPEPVPGRSLKWSADGTDLVNSTHDPDSAGDALAAADAAINARITAELARDQAQDAAGGVRVSADDPLAGPLADKLVAGPGISLAEEEGQTGRRLVISLMADQRLQFLELNLALNTLRDQIDSGWSVLKMVDGWADEFGDETGVDSSDATYDAGGNYYHNAVTGPDLITGGQSYTASHNAGNAPDAANGNTGTYWRTVQNLNTMWWRVDFGAPTTTNRMSYYLHTGSDTDRMGTGGITWQGSNDGAAWTSLAVTQSQTEGAYVTLSYAAATYRYYRLLLELQTAGDMYVCDVRAYHDTASNITLVSKSVLDATVADPDGPVEARLVLLHQSVDPVTLDTDLIAEASRDDGTTWTAGTLVDEGAFDSLTRILSATIDLSGQPAGTAMRWRCRTFNTKGQRLHGVWMQWR